MQDATDFRNLAELSAEALLLFTDGVMVYANAAARHLLGPAAQTEQPKAADLWQPDPLADATAWNDSDQLAPTTVRPLGASGPSLEITATRSRRGTTLSCCVRVRATLSPADGLASRVNTALFLSPDAAMVVDARTLAFLDANPAACRLMGMTLEDVRRRGPTNLRRRDGSGTEDFHARYAELIQRSPQALTHEYDYLAEDGRIVPVSATRQALNVDGRWLIFITWRDISAEVAAQAQRELFQAAFEQATDAICIVDVQALAYLYVNDAFVRLTGIARDEITTLGPAGLARRFGSIGDVRPFYADVIARHPETIVREEGAVRPDGTAVQLEIRHRAMQSGGRWLIVSTRIDITERKRQQRHLERITAAFDASGDGIYIIDPRTFAYADVNEAAARMHGLSRDELRALGVRGAFGDRFDDAALRARYDDLISRYPQSLIEERQIPRRDGAVVWAESIRRAIRVDGEWLIISVMRDISERRAAQARIERFAAVVNMSPDAVMLIDRTTMQVIDVNEATCAMHGCTREEMMALPVHLTLKDTTQEELAARYDTVIARSPAVMHEEVTERRPDGSTFSAEVRRQALLSNGAWVMVVTVRDLTDRKTAQARQELLTAAIEAAPDGIAVIDPQTLQFIHVNAAVCRTHATTREELLARGVDGMYSAQMQPRAIRAMYQNVIDQYPEATVEERAIVAADGSSAVFEAVRRAVWVDDRWLIVSMNRDVTERKTAQARIELFAAIVNLSADALFVIDRETMNVIDVNDSACRMYGYERDQLLGMPVHLLTQTYQSAAEQMMREYDEVIAQSPRVTVTEVQPRHSDGRAFHAEVQRMAIRSEGRWLVVTTVRDITGRKAADAGLRQLKAVVDVAPDGMYIVDAESAEYIDLNHAAGQLYGLSREEVLRMGMAGFMRWLNGHDPGFTLDKVRERHHWLIRNYPQVHTSERRVRLPGRPDIVTETLRQAVQVDGRWLILIVVRDITERKAAQARIERFAAIVNLSADAVLVFDRRRMAIVDVNETACRLYGHSRDEFLRLPPHQGRTEATLEDLERQFDDAIRASPAVISTEIMARRSDGSLFPAEVHRQAIRSEDDWLVVATVRDITERKAAQQRVERFAAVVNLSADGVFVVDRQTLRIIDVNDAACRLYGRSRDELLALAPNANRPDMDTAQLEALYDETIARSPEIHHVEHDAVRADGSVFQAETDRLAIQSDGRWLILATVRDITQRKRSEAEIRQRVAELELLRQAYDAAVDVIMIADPQTLQYYDVNQAAVQMLGVSREELLAGGVESSYYSTSHEPFNPDRMRKGYQYVISRAPEAIVDVRTVNPLGLGGRDTVIEFSRRAVHVQDRWVVVTLMRDITAARRAEEEIRQRVAELTRSNQELEQFAYVTSHDLSEPLRMVASYTQLLSRRYADKFDDDGREFIKYAVDGAQRMKQLIDDLLMYSRAGRSKVPMRHIRVDRALDDALANLANAIERNGATIERGPMPELVCEKAGLTQVFQNLIGNAIKFRGEAPPVVRISAVEDTQFWTISVADNGIGIAPEYFQRIFIIFQRLHSRTKYEGTGIGLSICKKIVERHGGQIAVTSEPGQGTTFSFTLSKSLTESETP